MLFSNNSYARLPFQESSQLALTAPHATHPEMVVGFGIECTQSQDSHRTKPLLPLHYSNGCLSFFC